MITLFDFETSGNCYKIRLMLSFLGLEYSRKTVDIGKDENRTEAFLSLNPRGHIPVLVDGDTVIWDSQAILVYLARQYGDERWLPLDSLGLSQILQWLAVSETEIQFGIQRARAVLKFGRQWNYKECQELGHKGLDVLNHQLTHSKWLAASRPTIADVGCFPYVALAAEANISLDSWPFVQQWVDRFTQLPNYVSEVSAKFNPSKSHYHT
jgi:glutathione S-transferase